MMERIYIFADPFARRDSGVTSYIANAANILHRNGISINIIERQPYETVNLYRKRLSKSVIDAGRKYRSIVVEAPESGAVTADIPLDIADIHIRLHCSGQLGALVQRKKIDEKQLYLEQCEINRANLLSAPSHSAVIASRLLFNLPDKICCYPNPAPHWASKVNSENLGYRNYALFVGRLHALKGFHWIVQLAQSLPEVRFLIAGPLERHTPLIRDLVNLDFIDVSTWSKQDIYAMAKVVVIPSLYETASMVGIEALAAGTPVIAWSHLGIAEYARAPMVTLIKPWQLDVFAKAIQRSIDSPRSAETALSIATNLNAFYLKGVHAILNGGHGHFMPVTLSQDGVDNISATIKMPLEFSKMSYSNPEPRWRRKLRKFQRNPHLFFKDSWLARFVWWPKKTTNIMMSPHPVQEMQDDSKLERAQLFSSIKEGVKIEFQQPTQGPEGFVCAFFYSKERNDEAQEIIKGLSEFDDFRYVREPLLNIGTFDMLGDYDVTTLIEKIDIINKKKISCVDHIILLNPPPILVEGLRSCGVRQRAIVIISDELATLPDPMHTDVLIVVGECHSEKVTHHWRRKIVVKERNHLPLAIRRAVQEGTPKSPDMLLPILGFNGNHREELMSLDARFYQGIIKIPKYKVSNCMNMADMYAKVAQVMTDLAVTESVYLRYRSLCDQIHDEDVRTLFLVHTLFDGVMFDVRV